MTAQRFPGAEVITVGSLTALSHLPTVSHGPGALFQGRPDGTVAFVVGASTEYILQTTSAVPGSVSVIDDVTRQWVPLAGTDASEPLVRLQQYVSTLGDDSNSGLDWQHAKLSIAAALDYLELNGGGDLHYESGVVGNFWFRGDGRIIDGWHGDFSLRVYGHGNTHGQFGMPVGTCYMGTDTPGDRMTPGIWLVGTGQAKEFHDMAPSTFVNQFVRTWDYRRDLPGALVTQDVDEWQRNGDGTATVKVSLPPGIAITSANVNAGVVTLHFALQTLTKSTTVGNYIRVVSSDPNFDSGDFLVTAGNAASTGTLTYTQPTSSGIHVGGAIGTWTSHDLSARDRFDLITTNTVQVPATMYRVLANGPDAVTITVADLYGGTTIYDSNDLPIGTRDDDGTWEDVGPCVLEDRTTYAPSLVDFYNLTALTSQVTHADAFYKGPQWDLGNNSDGRIRAFNIAPVGYLPLDGCDDPDRSCWLLADGGSGGVSFFEGYDSRPGGPGVRIYGSTAALWGIRMYRFQGDTSLNVPVVACEVVEGNAFGFVWLEGVRTWDNPEGNPDIILSGMSREGSAIIDCGLVEGGYSFGYGNQNDGIVSAWQAGQPGFWNGGFLQADLPQARRVATVVPSRYRNLIFNPEDWITSGEGTNVTTGIPDPLGGTGAASVNGVNGFYFLNIDTPVTVNVGDAFIISGWVRYPSPHDFAPFALTIQSNLGPMVSVTPNAQGFAGDGEWKFYSGVIVVESLLGSAWGYRFATFGGFDIEYFGVQLIHIAAADGLSLNEIYEFAGSQVGRPRYLTPGDVGTHEGVKLIAHGGLGTDTDNAIAVGGGSGQATVGANTKVLPFYAEDGTTILGWIPLYAVTINP